MEGVTVPEMQQRARSKTPFTLRSSCDREICGNLGADHVHDKKKSPVKKNPTVETIAEEKEAPAVNAGQRATRTKKNSTKIITSDYSSDDTEVAKNGADAKLVNQSNAIVTKTTTIITTSSKVIKSSGEQKQKEVSNEKNTKSQTVTKSKRSATKESSQNDSNALFEQSAKLKTSTPHAVKTNVPESTNGNGVNLDKHIAFKEYKESGEYWNKYPKTDYTYSKLSPHRREIRPGVIAMPNMSRKSLDHHQERVVQMAQSDPAKESYFRSRYLSMSSSIRNRTERAGDSYYDSQDENDLSQFGRNGSRLSSYYTKSRSTTTIIRRFITVITTFFSTIWSSTKNVFSRSERSNYFYQRVESERGLIGMWAHATWSSILSVFRYIYLGISSILLFDSWLLRSKEATSKKKKLFLLLLLVLLPLLLLSAWNMSNETDRYALLNRIPTIITSAASTSISSISAALVYLSDVSLSDRLKYGSILDWFPISSHEKQYSTIPDRIGASFTDDEYTRILAHVNNYIDLLVADKLEKHMIEVRSERISHNLALQIAGIVKEHIVHYKYILTDADCDRIAEIVLAAVRKENENADASELFVLSQENLDQITAIVEQQVKIHGNVASDKKSIDIDEITYRILTHPKLEGIFNERIKQHSHEMLKKINQQNVEITNLQEQIDEIKLKNDDGVRENVDIKLILEQLQGKYGVLREKLDQSQVDNRKIMDGFVHEVDERLSAMNEKHIIAIDQQIKEIISRIFGYKSVDGAILSESDITNWIRNVFVAKEMLEACLFELEERLNQNISAEINQTAVIIMKNVSSIIEHQFLHLLKQNHDEQQANAENAFHVKNTGKGNSQLDEEQIWKIVKTALAIYDADKTGMVDYALESAGGEILSTRCTENFYTQSAQISVFGIPLWYKTNTPRTVISPSVHPGDCWAFQGFPGYLVLKLNSLVYVTGFTVEHIPKSLSTNGRIDSAPKSFSVMGLLYENDQEPFLFGGYEFAENGTSLQYFPVKNLAENVRPYNIIELRIESNHDHPNYTCLYRFRVHGKLKLEQLN